jgi:hypothetical protein
VSSDQSPPIRKVVPYKSGKRVSTVRKLNLDFAGTALEQALMMKAQTEKEIPIDPVSQELENHTVSTNIDLSPDLNNIVDKQPSHGTQVDNQPSLNSTKSIINQAYNQPGGLSTKSIIGQVPGYKSPNILDDEIMPTLIPSEQVVLRRLFRLSYGFNRTLTDPVSYSKLSEKCHLGISALKDALRSLQMKGLIRISGNNKYSPTGGNQYEVTIADNRPSVLSTRSIKHLADNQLGYKLTKSINTHINHEDLKKSKDHQTRARSSAPPVQQTSSAYKHNDDEKQPAITAMSQHHQEVMTLYQNLTCNSWKTSDTEAYEKISQVPIVKIDAVLRAVIQRAPQRPNSFNYFLKEILGLMNPKSQTRGQQKKALEQILQRVRTAHAGSNEKLTIADLTYDVKDLCAREGVVFDNDLFNEVLDKR